MKCQKYAVCAHCFEGAPHCQRISLCLISLSTVENLFGAVDGGERAVMYDRISGEWKTF